MSKTTSRKHTGRSKGRQDELRRFALTFPQTHEDHPWGETALKVARKIFVFLGDAGGGIRMTVKLEESHLAALELPFCQPAAYGLGKSGWVTVSFEAKEPVPVSLLRDWIEESFRNVAPRRLVEAETGKLRSRGRARAPAGGSRSRVSARAAPPPEPPPRRGRGRY